jgi:hypothetical protein
VTDERLAEIERICERPAPDDTLPLGDILELVAEVRRLRATHAKYCEIGFGHLIADRDRLRAEVERLRDAVRGTLTTLDFVRGHLTLQQSRAVEAIDRRIEDNRAFFCEGMRP